jgi:chromosome segregation ATPase
MSEIALANINSFASPAPQVDFIQALLGELQALREEVARLQEDNQGFREKIASQDEEIASLRVTVTVLDKEQDHASEQDLIQLRLIKELRELIQPELQPTQKDRGDILRALLAANDGKILAKDARKKMHLSKSRFSELLAAMSEYIETKPFSRDHRQKVLVLK